MEVEIALHTTIKTIETKLMTGIAFQMKLENFFISEIGETKISEIVVVTLMFKGG